MSIRASSEQIERRVTTIVAADIVEYSRLVALDESGTISRFRHLRDSLIGPSIAAGNGRVIKTMGDGMLMEFPSPEQALRVALQVQNAMRHHETHLPHADQLRFRIGINYGEAIIDNEDVLGDVVNVAARLEGLAPPGGICVSQSVRDRLNDDPDITLTSLGLQYVKNIPVPVGVWNVHVEGVRAVADTPVKQSERPSIAVLAFDNLSKDPDQDFLAEGIAADVTNQLARFRSLFVIARNSAFRYRNTNMDVRQIAQELGVRYVVSGSVRRAGDRLRLTVTLVRGTSGETLWSRDWNRDVTDLFDLQDELTKAVVNAVAPELGANERALALKKPTQNLTAWELCQRGLAEFFSFNSDSYPKALELFQASAAADPDFALPPALLARWYAVLVSTGRSPDPVGHLTKGMEYAKTAIAMDDRLEDGYVALGAVLGLMRRVDEANEALDRAYALNANNAYLFFVRAQTCMYQPEIDHDGMEAAASEALALNPSDPSAWAFHYFLAVARWTRDLDSGYLDAKEPIEAACKFPRVEYFPWLSNAIVNLRIGNTKAARHCVEQAMAINPELTVESYRTQLQFPSWPTLFETMRPDLEALSEYGLPRG